MKPLVRFALALLLAGAVEGCTSYLIQQEGKPWPGHYADCPSIYTATRLEMSALGWALSGEQAPSDPCLGHYYSKAAQDPFYQGMNQWMAPLYVLSLPADLLVDTVTLPFAASGALFD